MANNLVALVLGSKIGDTVRSGLQNNLDNYKFNIFETMPEMLSSAQENEQVYGRIVVYETRITSPVTPKGKLFNDDTDPRYSTLETINNYLETHSETELVVICDKDESFTQVSKFIDANMKSPNITPVIPTVVVASTFEALVSDSIQDVRSRHYVKSTKKSSGKTVKKTGDGEEKRGFLGIGKKAKKTPSVNKHVEEPVEEVEDNDSYSGDEDDMYARPAGDLDLPPVDGGVSSYGEAQVESSSVGSVDSLPADFSNLSFGAAGSNHEETGYFEEESEEELISEPPTISHKKVEIPENTESSSPVDVGDLYGGGSGDIADYSSGRVDESVLTPNSFAEENFQESKSTAKYESEQPVYDPPVDEDLTDDEPVITDRIVLVTGDRGSGVTTKSINLAVESVGNGSKTLVIDLDFAKHGILGALENYKEFVKNDHSVSKGKAYSEDGLDFLSDGHGSGLDGNTLAWVEDSRNYANYNKIIIDCPIEYISHLGQFVDQVGIVYMIDGSQSGLMSNIALLDNRGKISNELALTFRDKGIFCVIRKEEDYYESLANLKEEVAIDRANWFSKLA